MCPQSRQLLNSLISHFANRGSCDDGSQYPIWECPDNAHGIYCPENLNCTKFGSSAFQCDDAGKSDDEKQCIPIDLLCDGYMQCQDGSGR